MQWQKLQTMNTDLSELIKVTNEFNVIWTNADFMTSKYRVSLNIINAKKRIQFNYRGASMC